MLLISHLTEFGIHGIHVSVHTYVTTVQYDTIAQTLIFCDKTADKKVIKKCPASCLFFFHNLKGQSHGMNISLWGLLIVELYLYISFNIILFFVIFISTEWQRPLSGVHSIIPFQAGEGGGCKPTPPFALFTITYKVVVYAPSERADTPPPLFLLYP